MLDRTVFFANARRQPFGNRLTQQQVDGVNAILDYWESKYMGQGDGRQLAYILATAFHETGGRMEAVREGFAKTDAGARRAVAERRYGVPDPDTGHVYYGRGHVQLTWKENYQRVGDFVGVDLVNNPDLALDPVQSVRILVDGMDDGLYTPGHNLSRYFSGRVEDVLGARQIVNGRDKASLIETYYEAFLHAIKAAEAVAASPNNATPAQERAAKPDGADLKTDPTIIGGVLASAGGLAGLGAFAGPLLASVNNPYAFAAFALVLAAIVAGLVMVVRGRMSIKRKAGA